MKNKILRSLSVLFAVIIAMTLSLSVLADDSSVVSEESVSEESADVSEEASEDASEDSSEEETSKEETSKDDTSKETSSATTGEDASNTDDTSSTAKDIPWARIITLIVIVLLTVAAIILSKTNTAIGQRIAKFFKEYWSEIKKVSWYSPKDTLKATGIVLVFIIGAAIIIGLLDIGFTKIIQGLASIF